MEINTGLQLPLLVACQWAVSLLLVGEQKWARAGFLKIGGSVLFTLQGPLAWGKGGGSRVTSPAILTLLLLVPLLCISRPDP